ncbi:MAG: DUF401 family protein, partial [Thermodesulfobacteriota bacterium]
NFLDQIPALLKVALSFALILGLNRLKAPLSGALLIGAIALGLGMGLSPAGLLAAGGRSLVEPETVALLIIVGVILALSRILADSGQLDRIVSSFTSLVADARITAMVMPALIGLLPMPGGALFSAPMVDSACRREKVSPEIKTVVNYWFRHIWEYWWPLYPGVVLAVSLLGVQAWRFMLVQFPLTLISVGAGLVFILPLLPRNHGRAPADPAPVRRWAEFRREVRPITLVVLALPAVWLFELVTRVSLPRLTSVFLGLGLCLVWVIVQNRPRPGAVVKAALNRSTGALILVILGIMVFKGVLIESRAVAGIQAEMVRYHIPPLAVILIMPFLSGLITGVAVGFVGASFPLIVPLLAGREGLDLLAHASLAYAFGYMGMMLSPVHVCFLVTKDYFAARLPGSYRYLFGPAAVVMAAAFLLFGLLELAA